MGYFEAKEYVSNSDLTALAHRLNGRGTRDLQKYYDFGTLVDAMITEAHKVNPELMRYEDGDNVIQFNPEDWQLAEQMTKAANADPLLGSIIRATKTQREVYLKEFVLEQNSEIFHLPVRVKIDFEKQSLRIGADLKTTSCTSLRQFRGAIGNLEYDRQAAWYMDIAGLDRFIISGISKKKVGKATGLPEVYNIAIERGDELYNSGRKKYLNLAYMYKKMMIDEANRYN